MDPVTHGITGALLGKGFFSKRQARVAIFAATLGAVFPDVDIVAELFSRDPLAIVKYHRAITHSFVALPFFAVALAALTAWYTRRRSIEAPSFGMLSLIYGVGIASHILLDGMTSFGTRMWYPLSSTRVAWDLLFIVDFSFATVILLPQVLAWIYRDPARSRGRAVRMWILFTAGGAFFWMLARAARYPFRFWVVGVASALLAVVIFVPAIDGRGFRVTRAAWCQGGIAAMALYLLACGFAHHFAFLRATAFAQRSQIQVDRIGALPIPPFLLDWGDAIRSPNGLYLAQFDLRQAGAPAFRFIPDSPPDAFIALAFERPEVRLYWQFVRFPSILSFAAGSHHIVELGENRFMDARQRSPQPFTYQLVFSSSGRLIEEGWLTNGVLRQHMQRVAPRAPGDAPEEKLP